MAMPPATTFPGSTPLRLLATQQHNLPLGEVYIFGAWCCFMSSSLFYSFFSLYSPCTFPHLSLHFCCFLCLPTCSPTSFHPALPCPLSTEDTVLSSQLSSSGLAPLSSATENTDSEGSQLHPSVRTVFSCRETS